MMSVTVWSRWVSERRYLLPPCILVHPSVKCMYTVHCALCRWIRVGVLPCYIILFSIGFRNWFTL